jgi:hypothetical protein
MDSMSLLDATLQPGYLPTNGLGKVSEFLVLGAYRVQPVVMSVWW